MNIPQLIEWLESRYGGEERAALLSLLRGVEMPSEPPMFLSRQNVLSVYKSDYDALATYAVSLAVRLAEAQGGGE